LINTARYLPLKTNKLPACCDADNSESTNPSWFWTKEWQEKEREADVEIAEGKVRDFESLEALMKDLHSDH
jgi:hypothetical protein